MSDPYTIAIVGVGGTILGSTIGVLLTYWLSKESQKSTQQFQEMLAKQNEELMSKHHTEQMEKIHQFGQAMYQKLHDLVIVIRDTKNK